MTKYNYIILGSDWDLYKFSYSDLQTVDNVKYIAGNFPPKNSLKGFFYRIHFNPSINSVINLPFKKYWNGSYFDSSFNDHVGKPLCFILFNSWYGLNVDITSYLREHYKGCKIVLMCQDLLNTKRMMFTNAPYDINKIKKDFDLVISFDHNDCANFGFIYHPLVFSSYHGTLIPMEESDIYMLARAKNRLDDIMGVYEVLRDSGLKVDMLLSGVDEKDQKYKDEIKYINSKGINYAENLQHILHSKCLLEIMQKNGAGFTQRGCEAVCLGKKLLTNNAFISGEPFFNPEYISTFSTPDTIDREFVRHIKDEVEVDYNYKEKMSPIELLDFIEKRL